MVGSMVTGSTLAALSYQLPLPKTVTKPLHASMLLGVFIAVCCGLHAVFKYHDAKCDPAPPPPLPRLPHDRRSLLAPRPVLTRSFPSPDRRLLAL